MAWEGAIADETRGWQKPYRPAPRGCQVGSERRFTQELRLDRGPVEWVPNPVRLMAQEELQKIPHSHGPGPTVLNSGLRKAWCSCQGAARGSCSLRIRRQWHGVAGGGGGLDTQGWVLQTQVGWAVRPSPESRSSYRTLDLPHHRRQGRTTNWVRPGGGVSLCVAVPVASSNTNKSQIFNSFQVQLLILPVNTSRKITVNLRERSFQLGLVLDLP